MLRCDRAVVLRSANLGNDSIDFALDAGQESDKPMPKCVFVPQRYDKGKSKLHLHLGVRFLEGESKEWCFLFDRLMVDPVIERSVELQGSPKVGLVEGEDGNIEELVLVDVVQLTESGEHRIPSRVRLRPLDHCDCFRRKAVELPSSCGLIEETWRVRDGEPKAVLFGRRAGILESELVDEVVEGTPEPRQRVTGQQPPTDYVREGVEPEPSLVLSKIIVVLGEDGMRLRFLPCLDFAIERIEVFGSPVELGVNALDKRVQGRLGHG